MLDDVAQGDHEEGQGGEAGAELGEDSAESGDEIFHQESHDADGQDGQDDRIDHGSFDFSLELLLAGTEVGDLAKHDVEESAGFAGSDHGDVDRGEISGPFGKGVAERGAADDVFIDVAPEFFGGGVGGFALEQRHGPAQGNAAGEEIG